MSVGEQNILSSNRRPSVVVARFVAVLRGPGRVCVCQSENDDVWGGAGKTWWRRQWRAAGSSAPVNSDSPKLQGGLDIHAHTLDPVQHPYTLPNPISIPV